VGARPTGVAVPYSKVHDLEQLVSYERLFGEVTLADLNGLSDDKLAAFPPEARLRTLTDITEAELLELDTADVHRFGERLRAEAERYAGHQLAIVARTDLQFGLARLFEAVCDTLDVAIMVFRSEAEARAWLGLPPRTGSRQAG
jgi:hypothetical protein